MNKKGITPVFQLFAVIFLFFIFALFLGLAVWGFGLVNENLNLDIDIGQVNLKAINEVTFGAMATGFINNADMIGIIVILGMIVMMMLNAYIFADRKFTLWLIFDIFILIFIFIVAVYLSHVYEIITQITILNVYVDDIPKVSKILLNLPSIIGTIGALLMIISYSRIKKEDAEVNLLSYG